MNLWEIWLKYVNQSDMLICIDIMKKCYESIKFTVDVQWKRWIIESFDSDILMLLIKFNLSDESISLLVNVYSN